MLGNAFDDMPQVCLWIEADQFCGSDQTVDRSGALTAGIGASEQILTDAPAGAFLFAENGEASMRELTAAIGERLGFYGPTISLSPEEGIRRIGAEVSEFALGSNSRVRAIVARTLGWHPQHNDLIEGIRSGKYAV